MNKDYLFLENFSIFLCEGYHLDEALNLCYEIHQSHKIKKIKTQLDKGKSIEEALIDLKISKNFNEYFLFFKDQKTLSEAILKSVTLCKDIKSYKAMIVDQLAYPMFLLLFLFVFSLFVVFIMIPNVYVLFDSFQIQMGISLKIIFLLFRLFPLVYIFILMTIVITTIHLSFALRNKKYKVIEFYLKVPIISVLLKKYFSLKFSLYMNELIKEGVDLVSVIHLLNDLMNDSDIKIVLYEMNNRLYEGESLKDIVEHFEYFDQLFLAFFTILTSDAYHLDALKQYIQISFQQIKHILGYVEKYFIPMIYLFVGVFVVTVYLAVILPMMNIMTAM